MYLDFMCSPSYDVEIYHKIHIMLKFHSVRKCIALIKFLFYQISLRNGNILEFFSAAPNIIYRNRIHQIIKKIFLA